MAKKILFITYDYPFPTNSGGKNRAYNLMKYAGENTELYLFSFTREKISDERIEEIKKIGVKKVFLYPRKSIKDYKVLMGLVAKNLHSKNSLFYNLYFDKDVLVNLNTIIGQNAIDIVHAESFYTGFCIPHLTNVATVFGTENVEYKIYEEQSKYSRNYLKRYSFSRLAKKIKEEEILMSKKSSLTLAVTEEEKKYFQKTALRIEVIPNGISTPDFIKTKPDRSSRNILFVGNFSYFPNVDAIEFFVEEVLPRLSHDLTLTIVGKGVSTLHFLNDKRIKKVEFVKDIKDIYSQASIFISPIRIGGGTNFKILESFACGLPVVGFSNKISALGAESGRDFLGAETGDEFVEQIGTLLSDDELYRKISENSREFVIQHFEWSKIGKKLNNLWHGLSYGA